ncbi:DUF819 family protein [Cesiribacter andamanensis]|uniref:Putative integral membrane protein n=1 Tax=Cesiribacter andamanensis AMV16 TaxID=1279009 RepID=M7N2P2_9BACT|nr:DUF819 family protein [Cesiribacter andamanensis]EMR01567.1 putative integral membrane protein [Cesiribacter andamanensis AMV16]
MALSVQLFWLVLVLFFPALTQWGEQRYRPLRWVGAMTLCYLLGLILGNLPLMPIPTELLSTLSEVSVSLAIPAMLFTAHPRQLLSNSRPALLAFGCASLAACMATSSAYFWLGHLIEQPAVTSGMLASVYIGGTPNMGAVGIALGVEDELFLVLNSADIVLSGLYFGFLLTIGPRFLGWLFPRKREAKETVAPQNPLWTTQQKASPAHVGLTLLYALLLLGAAAGLCLLLFGSLVVPVFILLLTVFSLALAGTPPIRRLKGTYGTAYYLLLMFAISVGSLANFNKLLSLTGSVLPFAAFIICSTLVLHYLFCRLAGLGRDISMIASTAGVFGPPFIGPVAERLKRPDLILTGILLGMLGYALGNFAGIGLARLLALF